MTIGFFHVDTPTKVSETARRCAMGLVLSVRKVMPYAKIVHFTDQTTQQIGGVDMVRRKPSEPMGLLRLRHNSGVEGEWVFTDTDVLFQLPVRDVFKCEFDIAVTRRDWSHLKPAGGFSDRMPFNTGVVFSRCPRFWQEAYTRLRNLDPNQQEWMGEQQAICETAAETDRYHVRYLKGSKYNFPPVVPGMKPPAYQLESEACILHYKGPKRKQMMLKRIREMSI